MTKTKKLQRKKQLYKDTQVVARHVIHDHKRRRARFMYQIKDFARKDNVGRVVTMNTAQYLYSVDMKVGRIGGINGRMTSWERLLKKRIDTTVS